LHRRSVLELLDRYGALHPGETACVARVRELVEGHADCFERTCLPGHLTASAWILSADRRRFLLGHHRKLDRWLQLGGHADGERDLARVALREAREESGMRELAFVAAGPELVPIDLDVHRIPARGEEPPHEHHDVRFLLVAAPGQPLRVSPESRALRWFAMEELERVADDESLLRLGHKARARLAEAP
jgi:8-oxo-dGTP pyrophosphatase MutT (NUDIX family)